MDSIKAGVKLVAVTLRRELRQAAKPDVSDLFAIWRIRTRFSFSKANKLRVVVGLP